MCRRLVIVAVFTCLSAASVACRLPAQTLRVNKVFTSAYSRREADRLVASGRVAINGAPASPGDRVGLTDSVTLDGRPFALPPPAEFDSSAFAADHFIYLKYWKPRGVTCTTDLRIDGNIVDALSYPGPERLFPVGRLDKESEGLILLTNDGRLVNAINRAQHGHTKLYHVECNRKLSDAHLRQLSNGVVITTTAQRDRGPPKPLTAPTRPCTVVRRGPNAFSITLTEGRNRQIRRMCEAIGFRVTRLERTHVMNIGLDGLRGAGAWGELLGADRRVVDDALTTALDSEPVGGEAGGEAGGEMRSAHRGAAKALNDAPTRPSRSRTPSSEPAGSNRPAIDTWGRFRAQESKEPRGGRTAERTAERKAQAPSDPRQACGASRGTGRARAHRGGAGRAGASRRATGGRGTSGSTTRSSQQTGTKRARG